jgi:transcription elongation factor Elf1
MNNAELIRVDFKQSKVIGRHQLGTKVSNKRTFTCNSCQGVYDVSGDVKGVALAKGFVVCSHCVSGAYELLNGGGE